MNISFSNKQSSFSVAIDKKATYQLEETQLKCFAKLVHKDLIYIKITDEFKQFISKMIECFKTTELEGYYVFVYPQFIAIGQDQYVLVYHDFKEPLDEVYDKILDANIQFIFKIVNDYIFILQIHLVDVFMGKRMVIEI